MSQLPPAVRSLRRGARAALGVAALASLLAVVVAPWAAAAAPFSAAARASISEASASCERELPVRLLTPTTNAAALRRIGFVRVIATPGVHVRDLRVTLARRGRTVARGSRAQAFAGTAQLRVAFQRTVGPGPTNLVATGRVAGCAERLRRARTLRLDGRNLPISVIATHQDARGGRLSVTLRAAGKRPISRVGARVLDARGQTIAALSRRASLRTRSRLQFALRSRPSAGLHSLLVTGEVRGAAGIGAFAETIELNAPSARADTSTDAAPPPPPDPNRGADVQQVAIDWSGGDWKGHDSAGFSAPGIGDGQLVCRPDTQWLRLHPSERARDVAMMLWTFRDWEGGSEFAIREAEMTRFSGPDFAEGFNKFGPAEKRSRGSFVGLVGDGLPATGTSAAGRSPTEVRLTWSWDFTDPAEARCSVSATLTSQGPGSAGTVARGITLASRGEAAAPAATNVPGLGTVRLRCDAIGRELVVEPDSPLPGLASTTYEGSQRSDRLLGSAPHVLALPNNGLVEAATPSGGALRLLISSRWKANDPDPGQNFCRASGLVVVG